MTFLGEHMLSILLVLPLAGAAALIALPDRFWVTARKTAFMVSLIDLVLAVSLLVKFHPQSGFQAVENVSWIPRLGISYHLGVDGLSMSLVLLTALLVPLAIAAPFDGAMKYRSSFYAAILFLEVGMLGVFMSLDLVLFYLFWEAMLLPVFFIIGVWGGTKRIYAAIKFIVYTLSGSLLMLVGMMVLYTNHISVAGYGTFSLPALVEVAMQPRLQGWLFGAFFVAFAIKAPVFPFHTWLPDAYSESPTAGSILLAGILAKMGVYGFLRFCLPLFPEASACFAPWVAALAGVSIIYGALLALAQNDLKRLVAYSSISHMGFITLGIFVLNFQGMTGAVLQMVSHGLVTAGLFMAIAYIQLRAGTRMIPHLGGLSGKLPVLAAVVTFFSLASMGLPGLSSFVGEFLIVSGALRYRLLAGLIGAVGLALGAVYILRMLGRAIFGEAVEGRIKAHPDLTVGEILSVVPLAAGIFWLGVFPRPLIELIRPSLEMVLRNLGGG